MCGKAGVVLGNWSGLATALISTLVMISIKVTDCPRSLRLLKVELAQDYSTTTDLVSVLFSEQVVQTEEQYQLALSDSGVLTANVQGGVVDHYTELKEAMRSEHLADGLKSAAETICQGNQRNVKKMDLHDIPSLSLRHSVLPFFPCLTRLNSLHLSSIILSRSPLSDIFAVLPESLDHLLIENLLLDPAAVSALSVRLQRLALAHFTLRNNVLEAGGMRSLAEGLKCQQRLSYLNIEHNGLGKDGGKWLTSVLPHLRALTFLEIRFNCFSEEDLSQLIRAMTVVPSLIHFAVDGNEVTEATFRTAAKYLPQFDMNSHGYFLVSKKETLKDQVSLKWGRMRNVVIVRELLRQRANF